MNMGAGRKLALFNIIVCSILLGLLATTVIAMKISPQATLEKREDFSSKDVDVKDDVLIEYAGVEGYVQTQPPSPYIYDCYHYEYAGTLYGKYQVIYKVDEYPGIGKIGVGKAYTRVYNVKVMRDDDTVIYEDKYGVMAIITAPENIT